MQKTKVLILCLDDPSGNPRPRRVIELCTMLGYDVSVMGYPLNQLFPVDKYFPLPLPSTSLFQKVLRRLWGGGVALLPFEKGRIYFEKKRFGLSEASNQLAGTRYDLLIVEDIQLLPLAFEIKGNAKILFDARECYHRQNEGKLWFELFEKRRRYQLCKDYMTCCDAVITVSEGLRQEYYDIFGISSEIIRSTPSYVDSPFHTTDPKRIRMIYHGAANRSRLLENLIQVASLVEERFSLDFMLVGNLQYQKELRLKASSNKRITFLQPVPFKEIIPKVGQYDIGIIYTSPKRAKNLPNKFFENIQARLFLVIGPYPCMAELVEQYGCGLVAKDFSPEAMARALNSLSAQDIDMGKIQSDKAARELCFEKEREKMISILDTLLN